MGYEYVYEAIAAGDVTTWLEFNSNLRKWLGEFNGHIDPHNVGGVNLITHPKWAKDALQKIWFNDRRGAVSTWDLEYIDSNVGAEWKEIDDLMTEFVTVGAPVKVSASWEWVSVEPSSTPFADAPIAQCCITVDGQIVDQPDGTWLGVEVAQEGGDGSWDNVPLMALCHLPAGLHVVRCWMRIVDPDGIGNAALSVHDGSVMIREKRL